MPTLWSPASFSVPHSSEMAPPNISPWLIEVVSSGIEFLYLKVQSVSQKKILLLDNQTYICVAKIVKAFDINQKDDKLSSVKN